VSETAVLSATLRCVACGDAVAANGDALACRTCGAAYPVEDGTVRLAAEKPFRDERGGPLGRALHRVVAEPRVYDAVQRLLGTPETAQRIRSHLEATRPALVLDVGAGTGRLRAALPATATYLWLDADPAKLRGYRAKWPDGPALLSDATELPLRDASVDCALCVAVAHHLRDDLLERLLRELARVVRDRLLLMEPLRTDALASRVLWRYDRGAHPRTEAELAAAVEPFFELESRERYARLHRYLLLAARPRVPAAA
jgi:SAM-dependent methyltransferase